MNTKGALTGAPFILRRRSCKTESEHSGLRYLDSAALARQQRFAERLEQRPIDGIVLWIVLGVPLDATRTSHSNCEPAGIVGAPVRLSSVAPADACCVPVR